MNRYLVSCLFIFAVVAASGFFFFKDHWEHRYDELIARHARSVREIKKEAALLFAASLS